MAKFALISPNLVVERVIVATPEWVSDAMPLWMRANYAHIIEVHATGEEPATNEAVLTHDCEPGSTFDPQARTFTRPASEP